MVRTAGDVSSSARTLSCTRITHENDIKVNTYISIKHRWRRVSSAEK